MTKHYTPTPSEVKTARIAAGLTQKQSGELVCTGLRTWQKWEDEGPSGRGMSAAVWLLFSLQLQIMRGELVRKAQ